MKKLLVDLISSALISGCATQKLKDGLPLLDGHYLSYAIGYLGFPNGQQEIAGSKVYTWGYSNTGTSYNTVSTPYSGTAYGAYGAVNYQGNSTSIVPEEYNYNCTIRLITDYNEIINSFQWEGNEGGCSRYSNAMDGIIADNQ